MTHKTINFANSLFLIYIFLGNSTMPLLSATVQNVDVFKYEVSEAFIGILRHNVQITNPQSFPVKGNLYVPLIKNATARHYAVIYSISSSEEKPTILTDASQNMYAVWENVVINGKQKFTAELTYYMFSLTTSFVVDSKLVGEYNKSSSLYTKYTQPEKLIESNNQEIISTANQITSNINSTYEKASKIYAYVISRLRYVAQEEEKGALWALQHNVGDCSEYSYLFVALCRAAGIPARIQAGFAFHAVSETLKDGHMWAEYYLENYGWIPVDATWKMFNVMDNRHFSSIQSIPQLMPYANYAFDSMDAYLLEDEQTVMLQKGLSNIFGEPLVESVYTAIQKVNQAKLALFLAKIFGATLIFPADAVNIEQAILSSQITLQKAIESLETFPQTAQTNTNKTIENAENALQTTWKIITATFAIFIGTLIGITICVLIFIRRNYSPKPLR